VSVAQLKGAGKRFGDKWALRHIDLSVPTDAVLGLVGPNGAGKSTLLHMLVGLTTPHVGSVTVFDVVPGSAAVLPDIAFVAQDAPLPRRMKIAEVVDACRRMNPRWDGALVADRLGAFELDPKARLGTLSGGERAQVALVLALAKRPRLLVLDEPVASLDPLARRTFLGSLMGAVAEGDLTVVYSTHLLEDLERACDHLAVLAGGELRLTNSLDAVLATHSVITGPAGRAIPANARELSSVESGRQAQHLVELDGTVHDPAWTVRPATLEEIVFAHLTDRRVSMPTRLEMVS
jgi:ABC-2 type transport system ATP-binding protein